MMKENVDYEVQQSVDTTWVNAEQLLGRFGKFGVDVHRDGVCISCFHSGSRIPARTDIGDWDLFVSLMLEHHKIQLDASHMPSRLQTGDAKNARQVLQPQ